MGSRMGTSSRVHVEAHAMGTSDTKAVDASSNVRLAMAQRAAPFSFAPRSVAQNAPRDPPACPIQPRPATLTSQFPNSGAFSPKVASRASRAVLVRAAPLPARADFSGAALLPSLAASSLAGGLTRAAAGPARAWRIRATAERNWALFTTYRGRGCGGPTIDELARKHRLTREQALKVIRRLLVAHLRVVTSSVAYSFACDALIARAALRPRKLVPAAGEARTRSAGSPRGYCRVYGTVSLARQAVADARNWSLFTSYRGHGGWGHPTLSELASAHGITASRASLVIKKLLRAHVELSQRATTFADNALTVVT